VKKIGLSTNVAVFLLFFGVALIEAIESGAYLKAVFWLTIGFVFLIADNMNSKAPT
jgi:hypothetical protein